MRPLLLAQQEFQRHPAACAPGALVVRCAFETAVVRFAAFLVARLARGGVYARLVGRVDGIDRRGAVVE